MQVQAVSGCPYAAGSAALFCATHFAALTVSGRNFGPAGAEVVLLAASSEWPCPTVTHARGAADSRLLCHEPRAPMSPPEAGLWAHVRVTTRTGASHTLENALFFPGAPAPAVLVPLPGSCAAAGPAALVNCPTDGTAFGIAGAGLTGYGATAVAVGPYHCPETVPHNQSYVECRGLRGKGQGHAVTVRVGAAAAATGLRVSFGDCAAKPGFWTGPDCAMCQPTHWGPACAAPCPGLVGAAPCSGHGHCDAAPDGTGACFCYADAARGHWGGDGCRGCAAGYGGPECRTRCPGVRLGGVTVPCAGRGVCVPDSGAASGLGSCACAAPYAGPACELLCSVGDATLALCAGHGVCHEGPMMGAGVCLCATGWAGPACERCTTGLTGPYCTEPCGGGGCAAPCPADAGGRVCGGHGACGAAGRCVCHGNYSGAACTACAPGHSGDACNAACIHGLTVGRGCVCAFGWAGADCGRACDGGAVRPCSGHGLCNAGAEGSGACVCLLGYTGALCDELCPVSGGAPCSGHGACAGQGRCRCQNSTAGHWAGEACNRCAGDFFGPACSLRCPRDAAGAVCHGHGTCTAGSHCACDASDAVGHWAGAACEGCAAGHWGPGCQRQCPGGSCTPCTGHGVCFGGTAGNGTCACARGPVSGYWGGAACADCAPGYHGEACRTPCPGGAARPCSGHGTCSVGQLGGGYCTCAASPKEGYWSGAACAACAPGYHGPDCRLQCPGGSDAPCSDLGTCDAGRNGSGVCTCDVGCVGPACEFWCPEAAGRVCNGRGRCVSSAGPACDCFADAVKGYWAGAACADCARGWYGSGCAGLCPGGALRPCTGHGSCSDGTVGTGVCVCIEGYAGPACAIACPGVTQGRVCGGHGACDPASGACACDGHWAGAGCTLCEFGWSGTRCTTACPRPSPGGPPCSGAGVCHLEGCVCNAGACGPACNETACPHCPTGTWGPSCAGRCPGGGMLPCGGHGECLQGSGRCLCQDGFAGLDCTAVCPGNRTAPCGGYGACDTATATCVCVAGYAGPACAVVCPTAAGSVCGYPVHGHCHDGPGGNGTCTCHTGYGGPACAHACPRGPGGACGGHGRCSPTSAVCDCDAHWAGAACDECRRGFFGAACADLCYRGTTRGRLCICDAAWGLPNCSTPCPGGALPCSAHGACNDTHAGDGTCACAPGWRGPACDIPCQGLLADGRPCSGHGTCLPDGACVCASSSAEGFWAGPACGDCAPGHLGANCTHACPVGAGAVCGGHGRCFADRRDCVCYQSPEAGYWDPVHNCTDCLPGFWGPGCTDQCFGGACHTCSGHGVCDGGVHGTGQCACDARWMGAGCYECAEGWHGPDCNASCPVSRGASGGPAVCGGHGTCEDGRFRSGECVCETPWGGGDCGDCLRGFFGPDCRGVCPGFDAVTPCSGHGRCGDGVAGDGHCQCEPGYAGAACGDTCPSRAGRLCNGVGVCDAAGLRCNCTAAPRGHWEGPACEACADGWVGPACDLPCPRGPDGTVCSGLGLCGALVLGSGLARSAQCECLPGYAGPACDTECAGGARSPCNGHGACNPLSGACVCAASGADGYWAGSACDVCRSGWSGPLCRMPCPAASDGTPCSGFPCRQGVCDCGAGWCGRDCSVSGAACAGLWCPDGWYGAGCEAPCPGSGGLCSGHGTCLAAMYAEGRCRCAEGYVGLGCELQCPSADGRVCAGHGACDPRNGKCHCYVGFATATCAVACPWAAGRECQGHGVCNGTASGNGACVCAAGYAGLDCGLRCPGVDPEVEGARACGGHGECVVTNGTAACACTAAEGHWAGGTCETCASGWFGPGCAAQCIHGVTRGRVCLCRPGYGAANCSAQCPSSGGSYCTGHGQCQDTHTRDGSCACDPMYYGRACAVYCDPGDCLPGDLYPAPHAQCNVRTGDCECLRDGVRFWAGAHCNVCLVGYWGPACDRRCDCNGHGGCGWLDGVCECFGDGQRGFWTGAHCGECLRGFLEPSCRARNVAISRPRELPALPDAAAPGAPVPAIVVADPAHHLLYTGGLPLRVFDIDAHRLLASLSLGGTVRSAAFTARTVVFLLEDPATGALRTARVRRGPAPTLLAGAAPRRRMRPQAGPGAPVFAEIVAAAGAVHQFIYGAGEAVVLWGLSPSGVPQARHRVASEALGLDTVRALALWPERGGRPTLLIAGAQHGRWGLTALPLDGAPVPRTAHLGPGLPLCAPPAPCTAVAAMAVAGPLLFLALERATGVVLAKVDLADWGVRASAPVEGVTAGAAVGALALDALTGNVFLVAGPRDGPSTLYKVAGTTLLSYGVHHLRYRAGEPERIRSVAMDVPGRRLYALSAVGAQPVIATFLLYAVVDVTPAVADIGGGTRLRVTAEGLVDWNTTECHFSGGLTTAATVLSDSEVACAAPATNATSEGCAGQALEVQLLPGLPTANGVAVRRIATPSVLRVDPDRGYYAWPQWVRVEGYGFEPSAHATCRFGAPDGEGAAFEASGPGAVQVVSGTELLCRQPDLTAHGPLLRPSYLEVSIDGQKFSGSAQRYDVVGSPEAVVAGTSRLTVHAAAATPVRDCVFYTVDRAGNRLYEYDPGLHAVTVSIVGPAGALNVSGAEARFRRGVAAFAALQLHKPRTGQYDLRVTSTLGSVEAAITVTVSVTITVLEGTPRGIHILTQPSAETGNTDALEVQPIVELLDGAGNPVKHPPAPGMRVRACVVPPPASGVEAVYQSAFADGVFAFRGIEVVAERGRTYHLVFMAEGADAAIRNATSWGVRAKPCESREFYLAGQTVCTPCPPGAVCNGSAVLLTQPNHWRMPASLHFLKCRAARGVAGDWPCVGGALAGTCSSGFTGPLCALCEPGRTGDRCEPCAARSTLWLIVIAVLVGYIFLVGSTTLRAFALESPQTRNRIALMFKLAVTHLQTVGLLHAIFPGSVGAVFLTTGGALSITLPTESLTCLGPYVTTYTVFYGVMLLPAIGLALGGTAMWYDRVLGFMQWRVAARLSPAQVRAVHERMCTRGRTAGQIILVALSVTLYFLYPTLMSQNAHMQDCVQYDFGQPVGPRAAAADAGQYGTRRFLSRDHSIDCASEEYHTVQRTSVVFTVVYGAGIPLAFVVLGVLLRWIDPAVELKTFAFLMIGYRRRYRYWETLHMVRKSLIVCIVTFVPEPRMRVYMCMWCVSVFLALQYVCQPFETPLPNALETASLLVLTVSLNLSLLWFSPYWDAAQPDHYVPLLDLCLVALILAMQAGLLLALVAAVAVDLRAMVAKYRAKRAVRRAATRCCPPPATGPGAGLPPTTASSGTLDGSSSSELEELRLSHCSAPDAGNAAPPRGRRTRARRSVLALLTADDAEVPRQDRFSGVRFQTASAAPAPGLGSGRSTARYLVEDDADDEDDAAPTPRARRRTPPQSAPPAARRGNPLQPGADWLSQPRSPFRSPLQRLSVLPGPWQSADTDAADVPQEPPAAWPSLRSFVPQPPSVSADSPRRSGSASPATDHDPSTDAEAEASGALEFEDVLARSHEQSSPRLTADVSLCLGSESPRSIAPDPPDAGLRHPAGRADAVGSPPRGDPVGSSDTARLCLDIPFIQLPSAQAPAPGPPPDTAALRLRGRQMLRVPRLDVSDAAFSPRGPGGRPPTPGDSARTLGPLAAASPSASAGSAASTPRPRSVSSAASQTPSARSARTSRTWSFDSGGAGPESPRGSARLEAPPSPEGDVPPLPPLSVRPGDPADPVGSGRNFSLYSFTSDCLDDAFVGTCGPHRRSTCSGAWPDIPERPPEPEHERGPGDGDAEDGTTGAGP